jgi:hypothetical protein
MLADVDHFCMQNKESARPKPRCERSRGGVLLDVELPVVVRRGFNLALTLREVLAVGAVPACVPVSASGFHFVESFCPSDPPKTHAELAGAP